ncbi:IclR family transcriptional regulator [Leekyejoonella antrihumi]|uniref:Glycerol operon regulatory protein n=1 Tax=Leekyejoonella antrihumi TaxID=1660198 RepID=A0A563E8K4_9MICO|nr:IclR family transcriptional regulator [Leekyejoonella antrihumi]TWP38856.1 IclR family transcriptional regulator [Leekyejoonella antrihumi]
MPPRTRQPSEHRQGAAASLFNGLSVLQAFSIAHPVLGVTEIADRVGLHKSTVSRILSGLADVGFVEREDESGRYRLGLSVVALAAPLLAELDVRRAALPFLEDLMDQTSETAAVSVWNGTEAVVVEQVPSPHQVKHSASIGTRYTKLESSSVRVFLAELAPEHAQQLLNTGQITRGDSVDLADPIGPRLARIRDAGVAVNDGLTTDEEFGVSAPVRDVRGFAAGCITLSAPRSRVHRHDNQDALIVAVRDTAKRVSMRLGLPEAG